MIARTQDSYKMVTDVITDVVSRHKLINDYNVGGLINDTSTEQNQFPHFAAEPRGATYNTITFVFGLFDRVQADKSNVTDVHSDTLYTLKTIVNYLSTFYFDTTKNFRIDKNQVSYDPVYEAFDDYTYGWLATVVFIVNDLQDTCEAFSLLRTTTTTTTPTPETTSLTITVSGNTIISGATVTLYDDEGIEVTSGTTDVNGQIIFSDLSYGDYSITVSASGYQDITDYSITVDEAAESETVVMTEITYYIASVNDIYGAAMTVTISSTTTQPTYTEFTLSADYVGTFNDKVYTGYNFASNLMGIYDVQSVDSNIVQINDPDFVAKENGRFAKLTVLPAVIEGVGYTGSQGVNVGPTISFIGQDLTTEFLVGAPVKITTAAGNVFYDIVYECVYKFGKTNLTCYMGQYIESDTVVVQTLSFV